MKHLRDCDYGCKCERCTPQPAPKASNFERITASPEALVGWICEIDTDIECKDFLCTKDCPERFKWSKCTDANNKSNCEFLDGFRCLAPGDCDSMIGCSERCDRSLVSWLESEPTVKEGEQ